MQMLIGAIVATPVALLLGNAFIGRDLLSGAASGLAISLGLAIVYHAMATSSAAVAAPVAAVLAAVVPLGWDLVGGASLSSLALLGCAVAVVSLGLTTFDPDLGDSLRVGFLLAILGGFLFGVSIVLSADTSEASGAWPAASQRLTGFFAMLVLARIRDIPPLLPPGVRKFGVIGGLSGALGMVAWILGSQKGDLGTVSVVASTYPAVVVVLANIFDGDRIRWWQALGIGGAIGGTALIALGG